MALREGGSGVCSAGGLHITLPVAYEERSQSRGKTHTLSHKDNNNRKTSHSYRIDVVICVAAVVTIVARASQAVHPALRTCMGMSSNTT